MLLKIFVLLFLELCASWYCCKPGLFRLKIIWHKRLHHPPQFLNAAILLRLRYKADEMFGSHLFGFCFVRRQQRQ